MTTTTRRQRVRRPLILLVFIAVLAGGAFGVLAHSASAGSSPTGPTQAGLRYAGNVMQWLQGPSVVHARDVELSALPTVLPRLVNPSLRANVNTADLIRRFGPHRRVEILVLSGVYNSLPPDEGVNIQGEAILLVDLKSNKVLFLTD